MTLPKVANAPGDLKSQKGGTGASADLKDALRRAQSSAKHILLANEAHLTLRRGIIAMAADVSSLTLHSCLIPLGPSPTQKS